MDNSVVIFVISDGCGYRVIFSNGNKSGLVLRFVMDIVCGGDMWGGTVIVWCVLEKIGVMGVRSSYTFLICSLCLEVKNKI